jgi:hypothetical protein
MISNLPGYADQQARMNRYQNLLAKLSFGELGSGAKVDWNSQDDGPLDIRHGYPIATTAEAGEPLVGNFDDAAAAMR